MGKYNNGANGSFAGTVGSVVGASWKNMSYMKGKRKAGTFKPSKNQVEQNARFTFLMNFISPLGKLFGITFGDRATRMTGVNLAFRYNYQNALTGIFPTFHLDYSKVLISKGSLNPAGSPTVAATGGGIVKFDWKDNSGVSLAKGTDTSILVIHCPELKRSLYIQEGPTRSTGTASFDAGNFMGKTVETWIAFMSADKKEVSTSDYTGQLVIS